MIFISLILRRDDAANLIESLLFCRLISIFRATSTASSVFACDNFTVFVHKHSPLTYQTGRLQYSTAKAYCQSFFTNFFRKNIVLHTKTHDLKSAVRSSLSEQHTPLFSELFRHAVEIFFRAGKFFGKALFAKEFIGCAVYQLSRQILFESGGFTPAAHALCHYLSMTSAI